MYSQAYAGSSYSTEQVHFTSQATGSAMLAENCQFDCLATFSSLFLLMEGYL